MRSTFVVAPVIALVCLATGAAAEPAEKPGLSPSVVSKTAFGPPGEVAPQPAPGTSLIFESQARMARHDAARLRRSGYTRITIGSLLTAGGIGIAYGTVVALKDEQSLLAIPVAFAGVAAGAIVGTAGLATGIGGAMRIRNANKRETKFTIGPIEGGAAAMVSGSF